MYFPMYSYGLHRHIRHPQSTFHSALTHTHTHTHTLHTTYTGLSTCLIMLLDYSSVLFKSLLCLDICSFLKTNKQPPYNEISNMTSSITTSRVTDSLNFLLKAFIYFKALSVDHLTFAKTSLWQRLLYLSQSSQVPPSVLSLTSVKRLLNAQDTNRSFSRMWAFGYLVMAALAGNFLAFIHLQGFSPVWFLYCTIKYDFSRVSSCFKICSVSAIYAVWYSEKSDIW